MVRKAKGRPSREEALYAALRLHNHSSLTLPTCKVPSCDIGPTPWPPQRIPHTSNMASLVSMRQVQAFRAGARAGPRRVPCLTQRPQRSSVRVRAEMGDDNKPQQKVSVRESFTHFTQVGGSPPGCANVGFLTIAGVLLAQMGHVRRL